MKARRKLTTWLGMIAILGVAAAPSLRCAQAAEIAGAGATFPYPIYAKWAEAYKAKTGISMNYQSIGSGGGIKQITAKTVDFGASDMPLKPEDLDKAGLTQFPAIMGGEVMALNLEGIGPGEMTLDGPTIANIYLGKITKWNDPAIAKLNPGLKLPALGIAVVHRSDGSGTTFVFTDYLSKVSQEWRDSVGESTAVEWPVGLGGKGNEGVAALTTRTAGAIGYVEYAYALQNKLPYTKLINKEGTALAPSSSTFQAAAANADWQKAPGFYLLLTDQPGKQSWPITGASFILVHKLQEKPEVARQVLDFFDWSYKNGGKMAEELAYVPMPESVSKLVEASWAANIKGADNKPVWTTH
ncbi:MAG TPA: phosphate ABC transporter substrate-binding protein PstS [Stellaceae bacterium]|nr:phosphate ABC transporter substrate-binding protein PstS [Stellaceae bacterium]